MAAPIDGQGGPDDLGGLRGQHGWLLGVGDQSDRAGAEGEQDRPGRGSGEVADRQRVEGREERLLGVAQGACAGGSRRGAGQGTGPSHWTTSPGPSRLADEAADGDGAGVVAQAEPARAAAPGLDDTEALQGRDRLGGVRVPHVQLVGDGAGRRRGLLEDGQPHHDAEGQVGESGELHGSTVS